MKCDIAIYVDGSCWYDGLLFPTVPSPGEYIKYIAQEKEGEKTYLFLVESRGWEVLEYSEKDIEIYKTHAGYSIELHCKLIGK